MLILSGPSLLAPATSPSSTPATSRGSICAYSQEKHLRHGQSGAGNCTSQLESECESPQLEMYC